MTFAPIVAAVAALVCLGLLALVLVRLRQLATDVASLPHRLKPAASPAPVPPPPRDRTEERLSAIEEKLAGLGLVLGRLDRTIGDARAPEPASAVPRAEPISPRQTIAHPAEPARSGSAAAPPPPPRSAPRDVDAPPRAWTPRAAAPSAIEPEVDAGAAETHATLDHLVDDYRQLLAQARKAEINRWFEQYESFGCEAGEDDTLAPVEREAGPLLMLVPFADNAALLLPSAKLVADFATSFSDTLALRGALRRTFALEIDGSGILRLLEAAMATRRDGRWRLQKPGMLGGLTG